MCGASSLGLVTRAAHAQPQPSAPIPREAWRVLAEWPARPQARPPGTFAAAAGLDVDPEGRTWVADAADHAVHVLDATGQGLFKVGSPRPGDADAPDPAPR